jgi:hypothetical protein
MRLSRVYSLPTATAIVHAAALLVPREKRKEWLDEWRSELYHVAAECNSESPAHAPQELTAFALGSFQDALWMHRESYLTTRRLFQIGSPSRCELILATMAILTFAIALALPGVRKVIGPSPYRNQNDLVTISRGGYTGEQSPSVHLADYRSWSQNPHHLFTSLAFYQPLTRLVHTSQHEANELQIARASHNLFELLDLTVEPINTPRISPATHLNSREPEAYIVLSRSAWSKYFRSDPRVMGKSLAVAGELATVTGIISDESWPFPDRPDLWLLENNKTLATLPSFTRGFVIARAQPSSFPNGPDGHRLLRVYRGGDGYDAFDCESLAAQVGRPCLALPATTSLPLGEYPQHSARLPWATRVRRWAFLVTKVAWIIVIVYCVSLDAAYSSASMSQPVSQYIQLATTFFFSLFAFRWALCDQRKRCPVCLRALTNPWLYLDPSWSGLFSAGYI